MRDVSQMSEQVWFVRDQSERSFPSTTSKVSQERLRRGVSSKSESASTVPASVWDIHVAHRALEGGGVPEVVDVNLDDADRESQGWLSGNRFEALSDLAKDSEREVVAAARPRRRLVLLSQNADPVAIDHEWDPDTESHEGVSDVEEEDVPERSMLETPNSGGENPSSGHGVHFSGFGEPR